MKIATSWSTTIDTDRALEEALHLLINRLEADPDLIIVTPTDCYDINRLISGIKFRLPNTRIHGCTSSLAVITEEGFHSTNGVGLGMLGIKDGNGSYGVGATPIHDDPKAAAASAIEKALADCDRPGELPGLILLSSPTGYEETVLHGIQDTLGPDILIVGGTSADNNLDGSWKQFTSDSVYNNAVVITAMFPSVAVAHSFRSGYVPTTHVGRATRVDGRKLYEIDNKPALQVYNEWTGGTISSILENNGGMVLSAFYNPFGRIIDRVGEIPYYCISHPGMISSDGAMNMLASINAGDELTLMTSTLENLVSRTGHVAQTAIDSIQLDPTDISGALAICCAGYLPALVDRTDSFVGELREILVGKPFLGFHTYGEQGRFPSGENRHGNLMISVLVFGS